MAEILINFDDALIQFTAVGGETGFAYDFPIFDKTHLVVLRQATASSAPVTMSEGTGYTVAGVGDAGGGTITFVTPATATAGEIYTLFRDVPEERVTDFTQTGSFNASTVNRELDLVAMQLQQLRRDLDRSARMDTFDPGLPADMLLPDKATRTSKFAAWGSNGEWIASSGSPPALVVVSTFMETVLDDASAVLARGTLLAAGNPLSKVLDAGGFAIDFSEGANIARAATTDIWATDGNTAHLTGTDTITSLGTPPRVGASRWVIFDGVGVLTDNANIVLPGGANITTAPNDFAFCYADTVTQTNVIYFKADGTPVAGGAGLLSVQVFTTSGTWTPSSGDVKSIVVEVIAGGGGGGGGDGVAAENSAAGGGGAGGYSKERIAAPGATETVTVGTGGAGGAAGNNAGVAGLLSSFGSGPADLSATGGSGGGGGSSTATDTTGGAGATGGVGSDGDVNGAGGHGDGGVHFAGGTGFSGKGGDSQISGGGQAVANAGAGNAATANTGGGGSGAATNDATDQAGGNGAAGIVIVWEYS